MWGLFKKKKEVVPMFSQEESEYEEREVSAAWGMKKDNSVKESTTAENKEK